MYVAKHKNIMTSPMTKILLQITQLTPTHASNITISMVTVVELCSEAGDIQCVFAPQYTPSMDFLVHRKTT